MQNSSLNATTLLAALALAAIPLTVGIRHAGWIPTIAGLGALLILALFDQAPMRSFGQSIGYGIACGSLLVTAALYPASLLFPDIASNLDSLGTQLWLPIAWLVATVLCLAVDRLRIGSSPTVLAMPPQAVTMPPQAVYPPPSSVLSYSTSNVSTPAPVYTSPVEPPPAAPLVTTPAASDGFDVQFSLDEAAAAAAVDADLAAHAPTTPPPVAVPLPQGKPATIYLNIRDAGIACLRSVQAEHLGRDFYVITEQVPPGESWQFETGQVVRCRKQKLSNGKAMVAFEEAPKASV